VKRRLGGWCEMAAHLGASQLKVRLWREYFMCAVVTMIFGACNSMRQYEGSCHSERTWAWKQPLLEAVTSQLLVKTLQAGRDLACAVVICKAWNSAIVL
jgi:hypothetical protein